jgi:5-methylcytosine-specific restriction endonuclease McrA
VGDMNYHQYIHSDAWRAKRAEAIERAGHRCQLCGKPHGHLNAHHNTYENLGDERPEDLCVLCPKCHKNYHAGPTSAGTIRRNLTRQLVRRLNLEPQGVTLTTSERKRRQNRALWFLSKGK